MDNETDTLPGEIWKPIPLSDGYSISSFGRFRADVATSRNWKAGLRKQGAHPSGHKYVRFISDGQRRRELTHRLVLMVFVGPPPSAIHQAAHNDGNPSNNRVDNLRWATPKENNADKKAHGTYHLGMAVLHSKLTDDNVRFIRQSDLSGSKLAAMFNVTRRTIDRARCGEGWPHIETPPVRRPQYGRHY